MLKKGQKFRILKNGDLRERDKMWVNAVVEHIPENGRFVRFRLHFVNMFGEHTSYIESFTMNELNHLIRTGNMVRR